MIFPFKQIAYWWREINKLRVCDTPDEFAVYVVEELKTPELVAEWVYENIPWIEEKPIRWNSVAHALKNRKGNCTEISCVNRFGINKLTHYLAMNLCMCGVDMKDGLLKGHAVCAFLHFNRKGFTQGGKVYYYPDNVSWETIAKDVMPHWTDIYTYWKDDEGNEIVGLP